MNASRIQAQLDIIQREVSKLREEIERSEEDSEPEPLYVSPGEYAKRANVSIKTVRKWLRDGMPCVRRGRVVRVKVAEADAWTPADTIAASAARAARAGR